MRASLRGFRPEFAGGLRAGARFLGRFKCIYSSDIRDKNQALLRKPKMMKHGRSRLRLPGPRLHKPILPNEGSRKEDPHVPK